MSDLGDVISVYTRAQAIDDGTLVDASDIAREAGFTIPVALTRAVWDRYVEVPAGVTCQDVRGRLWDVLWMLRFAVARNQRNAQLRYSLLVRNDNRRPRLITLKAVCGPGDRREPVITVMLPEED